MGHIGAMWTLTNALCHVAPLALFGALVVSGHPGAAIPALIVWGIKELRR